MIPDKTTMIFRIGILLLLLLLLLFIYLFRHGLPHVLSLPEIRQLTSLLWEMDAGKSSFSRSETSYSLPHEL